MPHEANVSRKTSSGMRVWLVAIGVIFSLCTCTLVSGCIGLWFFAMPWLVETSVRGRWRSDDGATSFDFRSDGKLKKNGLDLVYRGCGGNTLEIGPDRDGNNVLNGQAHPTIRYRVDSRGRFTVLVEITRTPAGPPVDYMLQRE